MVEGSLDSYPSGNFDNTLPCYGTSWTKYGQSSKVADPSYITRLQFLLWKQGSPTGTAYGEIWSHSGSFAAGAVPETLLATSYNSLDISTVPSSLSNRALFDFYFDDFCTTGSQTPYFYLISFNFLTSNSSNYIGGGRDNSSPSDDGQSTYYPLAGPPFFGISGTDAIFYSYGIKTDIRTINTVPLPQVSQINGVSLAEIKRYNGIT